MNAWFVLMQLEKRESGVDRNTGKMVFVPCHKKGIFITVRTASALQGIICAHTSMPVLGGELTKGIVSQQIA